MRHCSLLLLAVIILSGCATLNKDECLHGDWLTIGYRDAADGQPRERLGDHQQACAEYGVTPDFATYQQGYDNGLKLFCTPRNGFARGRDGYTYRGICPESLEQGFLQGYDGGREIHLQTVESNKLQSELQSIASRIGAIDDEIDEREHALFQDNITKEQRRHHYRAIKDMKDEQYSLEQRYNQVLEIKDDIDHRLNFLYRQYRAYQ